jgi:hypothetical protein
MEEIDGEELVYIKDVAIAWWSCAALFFYKSQKCGEGETLVPLLATASYNTKFWR